MLTGKDRKNNTGSAEITFQPEGRHLEIEVGSNILEAARQVGIDIQAPCGHLGLCGRCIVILKEEENIVQPSTNAEKNTFTEKELNEGYRLACKCVVSKPGAIHVTVPLESRIGHQRIVIQGVMPSFKISPIVKKITIRINKKQSSKKSESDSERLLVAFKDHGYASILMSIETIRRLSEVLREANWVVDAVLWGDRIILSLEPKNTIEKVLGFAVDIGTTKVAGYLVDLSNGELLAAVSLPNPQITFGEDLISRITYWTQSEEKSITLQRVVIESVNKLITDACKSAGASTKEIYDLTLAGNTVMHHIFFGISPKYVALSPFPVAVKNSFDVKAKDIGVKVNPSAYIHALPQIAGFVGADTVTGILATEIYKLSEKNMLIDIGTNAEIVVGNKDRLVCCSAPAGPAFEGVHIKHGVRASSGAIEAVWIDPKDYSVGFKTVEDTKPNGICGSGIIDVTAQLFKTGVIDNTGRFNKKVETPRIKTIKKEDMFVIAWQKETSIKEDITITQHDIQEVLLAKAAVYAGASILLKRMYLSPQDIKNLYIAGSFGTYIDVTNSLIIGLYPEIPISRTRFVGNTAGSGARMALLSEEIRSTADNIATRTEYIELASDSLFEKEFTNALWLPHREEKRFPEVMKMIGKH